MEKNLAVIQPVPPAPAVATPVPAPAPVARTPGVETGPLQSRLAEGVVDQADLRLVIEEQAGTYIYKTVDRRTGDVVAQYPREELIKLRDEENYSVGDVIRAKV